MQPSPIPNNRHEPISITGVLREVPIGFAQVMLQPSGFVGSAFLAGVVWNSWVIGSLGFAGCIAGTLTAAVLGYPETERRDGLYGFNGALVGLACGYFYEVALPLIVLVLAGGAASSIIMNHMLRRGMKPFTFPFVVSAWVVFAVLSLTQWATAISGSGSAGAPLAVVDALARGIGQVLFQESLVTGLIFLIAIGLRDRTQGLYVGMATSVGLAGAVAAGFPVDAVNLGLFGYNGVLCAILFAGGKARDLISAMAAIVLSMIVVRLFHVTELPAFTFPFVLSSWLVLWMRSRIENTTAG